MLKIDEANGVVVAGGPDGEVDHRLDSPEAFRLVSQAWVRCGWNAKYVYSFSWMCRTVIQLPAEMVRMLEVFYEV